MTLKEHKKHANLAKPKGGRFHRHEVAVLGAPCGIIQTLCKQIAEKLSATLPLGYVDADHGEGVMHGPFATVYTDKISHHHIALPAGDITYRFRRIFDGVQGVLVNGNHFVAEKQIVIINEKKEESLSRKLDRLTHVKAILLDEGMTEVFPFLKDAIPNLNEVPVFKISETDAISDLLHQEFTSTPPINGLVFAGGRSMRMGRDKGAINYHGKPQREYMADLLAQFCEEIYLSVREPGSIESAYPLIEDSFMELGPFGGLLSAFRKEPDSAWLAVACDVPLVDEAALQHLIEHRDTAKLATCYHNEETNFPEPMLALWEPRAYDTLLQFLALGYSCPRKVLINSDVQELTVPSPTILTNVNTPTDFEAVQNLIK